MRTVQLTSRQLDYRQRGLKGARTRRGRHTYDRELEAGIVSIQKRGIHASLAVFLSEAPKGECIGLFGPRWSEVKKYAQSNKKLTFVGVEKNKVRARMMRKYTPEGCFAIEGEFFKVVETAAKKGRKFSGIIADLMSTIHIDQIKKIRRVVRDGTVVSVTCLVGREIGDAKNAVLRFSKHDVVDNSGRVTAIKHALENSQWRARRLQAVTYPHLVNGQNCEMMVAAFKIEER